MRALSFSLLTAFCLNAQAIEITHVQGKVLFEGKPVTRGMKITESGDLSTGPTAKATVLLSNSDGKSEIALAPDSRVHLEAGAEPKPHTLVAGSLRARLRDKTNKDKFSLKTNSSVMAVRGTDFMAAFLPLLGDSEIIVFEGTVAFTNAADATDTKEVPKGHWGGVGGRYGKKIGDLIELPPHIMKEFDEKTRF